MTTRKLCLTAMGCALFAVLSLCLQVPVFENYYLCLGYTVMMVYCFYFGTFSSVAVGTLGVIVYCLLISGLRGMPGWAAGNVAIGLIVSLACKATSGMKNAWLRRILLICAVTVSCAVGILGIKSLVETVLYAQPFLLRAAKNVYAFVADVIVLTLSLPVCEALGGVIRKLFPREVVCA